MNHNQKTFVEIYEKKPKKFKSPIQIVACYLEIDDRLLLLKRSQTESEPGKWGVPAGKVNINEHANEAAKRELLEETGIRIENSDIQYIKSFYIHKINTEYMYHTFKVNLKTKPKILLSDEHTDYLWANTQDLKKLPLMAGAKEVLEKYYANATEKHATANVNASLILRNDKNQILLNYTDNFWGFPTKRIKHGESVTKEIINETKKIFGIDLSSENLKVAHVMHRKTNNLDIDIFYECCNQKEKIKNNTEETKFFSPESLPTETTKHHRAALTAISQGHLYSELGFSANVKNE